MKTILRRRIAAALSFVALIFVFPQQVQASHFRGGFMTASIAADGTVTINAETLWRNLAVGRVSFVRVLDFPSRTTAISSISVPSSTITQTDTTSDPSFTRTVQQFTTSLSSLPQGSYIIRWDSCCRISGIANAPESSFSLETVVHFDGTANSAPNILSSVITGVAAGFEYSQNINATDPDSTPLSYKFLVGATSPDFGPSSQIPGITVSTVGAIKIPATNTADLQVTNTSNPAGDYVFKVRITDSSGAYTDRDVLLDVVTGTNSNPPVLSSIGNRSVNLGSTLTFNTSATDADTGDVVTLSTSTLPANSTFTQTSGNPANGSFTFTPNSSQTGTHQINFEDRDNGNPNLVDSELITITVLGSNRAPVLNAIGNRNVSAGGTLTFTVSATDPDNDSLTYSASFLPSGATFDPATQIFNWVAPSSGVFTGIIFKVTDSGSLSDQEAISISVGAANQSPQITAIGDKGTRSGLTVSLTVNATDPDSSDTVTLSIGSGGLPPGATFSTSTGLFSWTPTTSEAGQLFTVNFVATDNGSPQLADTKPVKIGVGDYPSPSTATDPNNPATDGDGINDATEVAAGSNPLDASSTPTP